uniref:ORF OR26.21 protein n=1 Tax=Saccharomyces cerevisiae TaxID=4932 RepID=E9PA78_YEASX|nr:ORF OR26.21 [Saccharomyces cerevisiae]
MPFFGSYELVFRLGFLNSCRYLDNVVLVLGLPFDLLPKLGFCPNLFSLFIILCLLLLSLILSIGDFQVGEGDPTKLDESWEVVLLLVVFKSLFNVMALKCLPKSSP